MDLIEQLRSELVFFGFDICAPFSIAEYNGKVKKFPLPFWGIQNEDALGLIIGCTKAFWPNFTAELRTQTEIPDNPVDKYCRKILSKVVNQVLTKKPKVYEYEIWYDHDRPTSGRFVHIQTAGHVAGVAFYDQEVQWSASCEYGVWFVLRGVVSINLPFANLNYEVTLPQPVFMQEFKQDIKQLTEKAISERWQNPATLLAIRDCCPVGKDKYRYSDTMLEYFYPIGTSRQNVLQRIHRGEG